MAKITDWLHATRPKTLAAGAIPVLIGSSLAYSDHYVSIIHSLVAFICSIMIQIITNLINEIYDYKKGADNSDRLGPKRMVAAGIVSPQAMRNVVIILILITFALGMILVAKAGIPILLLGILSLSFAYLYTGGPFPLAYKGISEVFVFIFFGLIAVGGTYFVLVERLTLIAFLSGIAPGLISTNILLVNNIRDIQTDKKAGKLTLSTRIGREKSILLYIILNHLTFLMSLIIFIMIGKIILLLPILVFPLSMMLIKALKKNQGQQLNKTLAQTGVLLILFGILNSIAYILM